MKVCVFGAGAIGGYVAVQLVRAGVDVTVIARGTHLEAIRRHGLTLETSGERRVARVPAVADPAEAGAQDVVIVTVKAHSLPEVARTIGPLLGESTTVVSAMNGIPWWYFHGLPLPLGGSRLESLDRDGSLKAIDLSRIVGAIVFASAEVTEPGVVRHSSGNRVVLGEPDGATTERVQRIAAVMTAAGFDASVTSDIREPLWVKLWLNLSFNPISVLTHETIGGIASDEATRDVVGRMMTEARAVAEGLGVTFQTSVATRMRQAAGLGPHKTSMLQDLERTRPLELDPLVVAVQEMARLVRVATPTIDTVLALARQRARGAGLYPPS